jgi:hypothetical protein
MLDNQYFKKYLADRNVDLSSHIEVEKHCTLEIDANEFETFAHTHRDEATIKSWHPRPFLGNMGNEQAINANWIGYNKHNTSESNWGLEDKHNQMLREMIGRHNFEALDLDYDKSTCQTIRVHARPQFAVAQRRTRRFQKTLRRSTTYKILCGSE